jgi:hypothetical protein
MHHSYVTTSDRQQLYQKAAAQGLLQAVLSPQQPPVPARLPHLNTGPEGVSVTEL